MTKTHRHLATIGGAVAVCIATVAHAQLVDDFSGNLNPYTLTRILDNGIAENNISFSNPSGSLLASYTGTISQPEQVVFLRNDVSLPVGDMLIVNTAVPASSTLEDFGIMVSETATPTGVAGTTTDTRGTFNWASISIRPSQTSIRVNTAINGTVTTGAGVIGSVAANTVSQLIIERNSATSFTLGYYNTSSVLTLDSVTPTFTVTGVGNAIGFYADLRAVGGSLGNFDNFTIAPIPEPGVLSLLGLGGVWVVSRIRRK